MDIYLFTWIFGTFQNSTYARSDLKLYRFGTRESMHEGGNSCYASTFWIFIGTSGVDDRDNRRITRHRFRRLNFNVSIAAVNIHDVNEAFLVRSNNIVENHIATLTSCKMHEFTITKLTCIYR